MDIVSLIDWIPGINKKTYRPDFYTPENKYTRTIKYKEKKPPYKIAFVNGYAGNNWRNQALRLAKAWAVRPENKKYIKKFEVVSVGDKNDRLISVINNYIDEDFDAIVFIAVNNIPLFFETTFNKVKKKETVLVVFDNILTTDRLVRINENQFELGVIKAKFVMEKLNWKAKKIFMVNGLAGNSVDLDNRLGMLSLLEKIKGLEIKQVWGKWDPERSYEEVRRVLKTGETFDAFVAQQGSSGVIKAVLDCNHPIVPMGLDGENTTRILMAENEIPGISASQSPAMSAVALEAAVDLLQGKRLPRTIFLPIPQVKSEDLKDGVNYFSHLKEEAFDTGLGYENGFEPFTVEEMKSQTPDNLV